MLRRAGGFKLPHKCKDAIEQYRRDVNPARAFLIENFVAGLEYEGLPAQQVYGSHVEWRSENGHKPLNNSNFGKEVKRALPSVKTQRRRDGSRRLFLHAGMAAKGGCGAVAGSITGCPVCP